VTADALTLARRASQRLRRDPMLDLRLTRPQRQWVETTHPRAVWRDGNRLGKSWAQAADIVLFARGMHPNQTHRGALRIVVASESWAQFVPLQRRLWDLLPRAEIHPKLYFSPGQGIKGFKEPVIPFVSGPAAGTEIILCTYQQGAVRLAGGNYHRAYCDEPPPETFVGELLPRLAQQGGHLRMTFTPTPESPPLEWLRDKVDAWKAGKPGGFAEYNHGLTPENVLVHGGPIPVPYMTAAQIEQFAADCLPVERAMRMQGAWDPLSAGRWLTNYGPGCHHYSPPPVGARLALGIDHGAAAGKQAAVLVACTQDGTLAPRVWVMGESLSDGYTTPEQDARAVLAMLADCGVGWDDLDVIVGDRPTGRNRFAVAKSNRDLAQFVAWQLGKKRREVWIDTPKKWAGSVNHGFRIINAIMGREDDGRSHFLLAPTCGQLTKAIQSFEGDRRDPHKDILDAARYAIERLVDGSRGWAPPAITYA